MGLVCGSHHDMMVLRPAALSRKTLTRKNSGNLNFDCWGINQLPVYVAQYFGPLDRPKSFKSTVQNAHHAADRFRAAATCSASRSSGRTQAR
eukprot:446700-Amphidinium_carterae.2